MSLTCLILLQLGLCLISQNNFIQPVKSLTFSTCGIESHSGSDSERKRNITCFIDKMPSGLPRPLSEETTASLALSRWMSVCVTAKCQNDESTKKPLLFDCEG